MFRTESSKVEKSRVAAHESAESGVAKVHTLIDKVAEHAEAGGGKAAVVSAAASAKGEELRARAEQARKQARKDTKKSLKRARKNATKGREQAVSDVNELMDTLVDDILPKVLATATGIAASSGAAGRRFAEEAQVRGPQAFSALKDDRDTQAALAALKGQKPKRKRGLKVLLLALVAGAVAAVLAKKQQGAKKDPWAVPAGDPYKAPETGRDSTVSTTGAPLGAVTTGPSDAGTPLADEVASARSDSTTVSDDTTHAAMTGHPDGTLEAGAVGETRPLTDDEVDSLAADTPADATDDAPVTDAGDAWSSAQDWADEDRRS